MNKDTYNWLIGLIATGNIKKFYLSKTIWIPKRREILKRDHNECQECKKLGKYSPAEVVHHIKHLKDRPDLALTDSNLESVCSDCHNKLHPEKAFKYKKKKKVNEERWD